MRIATKDLPIKVSTEGAVARHQGSFGDADGCGTMAGEHFRMAAGTDITPLLKGLESDLCQSPHWGYLIEGELTAAFGDGTEERVTTGDLFYWPPGHTVRVNSDSEFVLFSPQHQHAEVLDHINTQLGG
jgi:hypothetical protein